MAQLIFSSFFFYTASLFLFTPLPHLTNAPRWLCFYFISFLCHINPSFLLQYTNAKYLPLTFHTIPTLFVEFTLIPSHLAHPSLQFVAENLQSCTVGLLLFDWDFLIHTFSLLTAPAAKQYQEEQAICARHKLLSSLPFPLKANRWNCSYALRQLTQSAIVSYYTGHTCSQICLHVKCIDVDCRERKDNILVLAIAVLA